MLLKRTGGINYFVALPILLVTIAVLTVAAFILVASFPGALGLAPLQYEIKEVYQFEPWSFNINGLAVDYPQGGIVIPFYLEEKQEAVLFLGEGSYLSAKLPLPEEELTGLFLFIDYDRFAEMRGDIIFIPAEEAEARAAARNIYAQQPVLPVLWEDGIPLVFPPRSGSSAYYFLDKSGEAVMPPQLLEPPGIVYGAAAVYIMFFGIILLAMLVFTLDHHPTRYWNFIHSARPGGAALAAAGGAAALALGGELLPYYTALPEHGLALGYLAAAGLTAFLARHRLVDFLDFGIRLDRLKYGYLTVTATAVLVLLMTRGIPSRFNFEGPATLRDFMILFFLVALAREAIWRGYIQTTLSRRFGAVAGLALTALLATAVHAAVMALRSPWLFDYPYTLVELAVLVPGSAVLLGFLYLRTENILSCSLLHSLILFIPRLIVA